LGVEGANGAVRRGAHGVLPVRVFTVPSYVVQAVTEQLDLTDVIGAAGAAYAHIGEAQFRGVAFQLAQRDYLYGGLILTSQAVAAHFQAKWWDERLVHG